MFSFASIFMAFMQTSLLVGTIIHHAFNPVYIKRQPEEPL